MLILLLKTDTIQSKIGNIAPDFAMGINDEAVLAFSYTVRIST